MLQEMSIDTLFGKFKMLIGLAFRKTVVPYLCLLPSRGCANLMLNLVLSSIADLETIGTAMQNKAVFYDKINVCDFSRTSNQVTKTVKL